MSARRFAVSLAVVLLLAAVPAAWGQINGILGIYLDDRAAQCSGNLSTGTTRTLYVMLLPEGDTRRGISGAEFSIDVGGAPGYSFFGEEVVLPNGFRLGGPAVGNGLNVVSTSGCESRLPLPILKFQVQNLSGNRDAVIGIAAKNPPGNHNFPCPLVTLCDSPVFTAICITPDVAVLNPSGAIRCGSSAEASEWGRVKELYR